MDPQKILTIIEWKDPRCVEDVQSFLRFAKFYRRFIAGYSKIAAPLTTLTKTAKTNFVFPWSKDSLEQTAFAALKLTFTTAPIRFII